MNKKWLYDIFTYCIAAVWLVNGLYCKLLNFVPRHKLIVSEILSKDYAGILIQAMGISEIMMAIWIISGYKKTFNVYTQILIIGIMNIIEYIMVPELLLWGKMNIVFAAIFVLFIYFNEFVLNKKLIKQA